MRFKLWLINYIVLCIMCLTRQPEGSVRYPSRRILKTLRYSRQISLIGYFLMKEIYRMTTKMSIFFDSGNYSLCIIIININLRLVFAHLYVCIYFTVNCILVH